PSFRRAKRLAEHYVSILESRSPHWSARTAAAHELRCGGAASGTEEFRDAASGKAAWIGRSTGPLNHMTQAPAVASRLGHPHGTGEDGLRKHAGRIVDELGEGVGCGDRQTT